MSVYVAIAGDWNCTVVESTKLPTSMGGKVLYMKAAVIKQDVTLKLLICAMQV